MLEAWSGKFSIEGLYPLMRNNASRGSEECTYGALWLIVDLSSYINKNCCNLLNHLELENLHAVLKEHLVRTKMLDLDFNFGKT